MTGRRYRVNPETGCWEWQGTVLDNGYGQIKLDGRKYAAHRLFYEMHVGRIPRFLQLDHLCRNTRCVNPAHLEPVGSQENTRRGKAAKLSVEAVLAILADAQADPSRGVTVRLAKKYGVSESLIGQILKGKRWDDVYARFHKSPKGARV